MKHLRSILTGLTLGGWLFLTVGVTVAGAVEASTSARVGSGLKTYACPPGAPPNSSLCSPAGWLVLEQYAAQGAAAVTAPAVVAATSTTGVMVASVVNATGLGLGLGISIGGVFGAEVVIPDLPASDLDALLPVPPPGLEAGWVSQDNIITMANGHEFEVHLSFAEAEWAYGQQMASAMTLTLTRISGTGCETVSTLYMKPAGVTSGNSTHALIPFQWYSGCSGYPTTISTSYTWYPVNIAPVGGLKWITIDGNGAADLQWQPAGYPGGQPAAVATITDRTMLLEVEYDCINAASVVSNNLWLQTYTVTASATTLELPDYACAPGSALVGFGMRVGPDVAGLVDLIPYTETPSFVQTIPVEVPECLTDAGCHQSLWKWNAPLAEWESCGQAAIGCPTWVYDIARIENYECRLGTGVVALDICSPLRRPGQVLPTIVTTTQVGPNGQTEVAPAPLPAPTTPPSDPSWQYPADPGGETDPLTPYVDGGTAQECFPSGWGILNPFEWVYKPVRCVFIWAFVPRSEVIEAAGDQVKEAIKAHGVLGVLGDMAGVPEAVAAGWVGACIGFGNFAPPVEGLTDTLAIPCTPAEAFPGGPSGVYDVIYGLVSVFLIASTGWACLTMVRAHFGGK